VVVPWLVDREGRSAAVAGIPCEGPLLAISAGDHVAWLQALWRVMAAAVMAKDQLGTDPAVTIFRAAADRAGMASATGFPASCRQNGGTTAPVLLGAASCGLLPLIVPF
jgi:hypothetical protein